MLKHMTLARSYLGTKEITGPADNPKIIEMYASVGHDWVEHDEVAWCAAFVGHCLERAGIPSTRKLTARSYLAFGDEVELKDAREGDIVIFSRGSNTWQGHVAFFLKRTSSGIQVLGGNQGNAVTVATYSRSRLLGIRRSSSAKPRARLTVLETQRRLKALGYHEVGELDGEMGPRTQGAILAFRHDNGLPLVPVIDTVMRDALEKAERRPVADKRAAGVPKASRIIRTADKQLGGSLLGMFASAVAVLAPVLDQTEQI